MIATENLGVSFQVFQEVFVTATRKLDVPLSPEATLRFLKPFLEFPFVAGSADLFLNAARLSVLYRIHYYEAAIVAAARELNVRILYSEDLNDGQDYDGVTVVNPFRKGK